MDVIGTSAVDRQEGMEQAVKVMILSDRLHLLLDGNAWPAVAGNLETS